MSVVVHNGPETLHHGAVQVRVELVDYEGLSCEDGSEVPECEVANLPSDLALAVGVLPGPERLPHLELVEVLQVAGGLPARLSVHRGQGAVEMLHRHQDVTQPGPQVPGHGGVDQEVGKVPSDGNVLDAVHHGQVVGWRGLQAGANLRSVLVISSPE